MFCFFLWCLFWFSSYLTSFCQLAKYSVCNLSCTFADYQRCEKILFKLEIVSRIMELDFRLDRNKCYFDVISQINIGNTKPCYSFHLFSVVSSPLLSPTEWSLSVFFKKNFNAFTQLKPVWTSRGRQSRQLCLCSSYFTSPNVSCGGASFFKTLDKQLHQVVKGRRYMPNTCCSAPELILLNFFKCIFFI